MLTLSWFFCLLPVPVVRSSLGIAVVAEFQAGFRVVEVSSTVFAGAIRERFVVDFGVVLAFALLCVQFLAAGGAGTHRSFLVWFLVIKVEPESGD